MCLTFFVCTFFRDFSRKTKYKTICSELLLPKAEMVTQLVQACHLDIFLKTQGEKTKTEELSHDTGNF